MNAIKNKLKLSAKQPISHQVQVIVVVFLISAVIGWLLDIPWAGIVGFVSSLLTFSLGHYFLKKSS